MDEIPDGRERPRPSKSERKREMHRLQALGERLVGLLSERDYARKVILKGRASRDTLVREIMTPEVICVSPQQNVEGCMALMTEKRCRHLPVLVDKKVIGIISIGDVVRAMITDQQQTIEQLEQYIMS